MKTLRRTPLALAVLGLCGLGLHGGALAQSNADLLKELQELKARVQQLEKQLTAAPASAAPTAAAIDPEEFNRIRLKVEAQEDATESMGFKGLRISGMMDPTFVANKNRGTSSFAFLNNFDGQGNSGSPDAYAYDNSYFGTVMLDFQKETESGQKWRFTMAPHKSANSVYNYGSIVHEASVSIPVDGPNTRLIAGQLPDWSGYEYIWSNQQPLISHNLLFDFTIPSYYSGAGMEFINGKWDTKVLIGNINKSLKDPTDKSVGLTYRTDYAQSEFTGFGAAGTHTFNNTKRINLFEVDGYYTRGDLSFQAQLGQGSADGLASNGNGGRASWTGTSFLLGYKLNPKLQLTGRYDTLSNSKNGGGVLGTAFDYSTGYTFDDHNGFGPAYDSAGNVIDANKGVNRYALSVGLSYLLTPNHTPGSGLWNTGTWIKTELRYDGADGNIFLGSDSHYRHGSLMFLSSIVFAF